MLSILIVFSKCISLLLSAVSLCMLVRMILSFFPSMQDSRVGVFTTVVTEPFVIPVRALLYKFNVGQDSPIDWAFSLTYILIYIVQLFLPVV
ncbi:MAG: YggT family protein [Clostridia bacterium]|nr:YggT family protein [Clostridia bacterium]MBQ8268594.1 YggT family protein [Clostridia bacterium]MBR2324632.1 YggT family protein [Clostridia bacterium]